MGEGREPLGVEVLGPLRVVDVDGGDVTPTGALQRRLLALLVLRRGRAVSVDSAIDVLWPSSLPADPVAALQNHLLRLRRGLPGIDSVADGYRLDPAGVVVDADRLATLVAQPTDTDAGTIVEIDAILGRWSGPAFPELQDADDGRAEAALLEALRVRAREWRAEARLARGDIDGVVADLTILVEDEPLRERPRAVLMAALAAGGRRVEALRVYDDFRRLLGDELGIEPSPALATQHAALLDGTPTMVWEPRSRVPASLSSLIGRESFLAEARGLLGTGRLVTLVGPGGVGKTRLLGELGRSAAREQLERPVVWCDLTSADPLTAADVVAAALGIDGRPGVPSIDRIVDVVGDTELVLLVDNCEHVLDPVAELVERLLASCANVRVAATSRERLRVPGEHVRAVPVLRFDSPDGPAVRLFVERARAAIPDFEPTGDELEVIGEIVRRLDGLPLAIELAAACLHTHDVSEIAAGLEQRFELLASGYRASTRHGSLRAAVSWSFVLLDDQLQRLFADLSVFTGSFAAADAAAIAALDEATVGVALAQLVERSLVVRAADRRYVLLETLRSFGAEELVASGQADRVRERHARYRTEWAEQANCRVAQPGSQVFAEIDAAVADLRNAFGWLVDHGEVELAGRLVAALWSYGLLRLRPDVLAWSERVLAADPDDRSPAAALAWMAAAYAVWMAGDVPEVGVRAHRALRISEASGAGVPGVVAMICGSFDLFEGRVREAADWYRRSADVAARSDVPFWLMARASELMALGYAGDRGVTARSEQLLAETGTEPTPYAAYVWYCVGEADLALGHVSRARARLDEALVLAEQTNAAFVIGVAGTSRASIEARSGDPAIAAGQYRRLIDHWRRAGMWSTQWTMLRTIAGLLERLGRHRDAAMLEGAIRATAAGHRLFGADAAALDALGERLHRALGDEAYEAARRDGAVLDGDGAVEHALRAL